MSANHPSVARVASLFWSNVEFLLTHEARANVDALNAAETGFCADHIADVVEHNWCMLDAMTRAYSGMGLVFEYDQSDTHDNLMHSARDLVKNTGYAKDIGDLHDMCDDLGLCSDYEAAYEAKMHCDSLFFFQLLANNQ
tara:strand:+ start:3495 stop:3911 length:417 start_codon:yes stop_codon:yes gene_type:complete